MQLIQVYPLGALPRLTWLVQDADGVGVDPFLVTLTVRAPTGVITSPLWEKDDHGSYRYDLPLTAVGTWRWWWSGVDEEGVEVAAAIGVLTARDPFG